MEKGTIKAKRDVRCVSSGSTMKGIGALVAIIDCVQDQGLPNASLSLREFSIYHTINQTNVFA